jgi:hemerythrin-like metal-binding protein
VERAALSGDNDVTSSFASESEAELPSGLLTGNAHLDVEHGLLMGNIDGLRMICIDHRDPSHCGGCQQERRTRCENELVAMLGDLLAFILDHFCNEERIMRESLLLVIDREVCEAHMEDHAAISGKIQEIVAALDPLKTVSLIRELDSLLSRWVRNHVMLHDCLLARWIEREDSILRRRSPPTVT